MDRTFGLAPFKRKDKSKKFTKQAKTDKRVYTKEGDAKRMAALRHNQLTGFVALTQKNMYSIGMSDTTTVATKRLAAEIYKLCDQLKEEMKTRIDPKPIQEEPE